MAEKEKIEGMYTLKKVCSPSFAVYTDERLKISNREIMLSGTVLPWMAEDIVRSIRKFNNEKNADKSKTPIKFYLSSHGGYIDYAMDICIAIRRSKIPVHIYTGSVIASAALPMLAAGHKRIGHETTSFLHHNRSHTIGGPNSFGMPTSRSFTSEEHRITADRMDFDSELVLKFLAKRTKLSVEEWKKLTNGPYLMSETAFTAEKALEYGLIDEIEEL